MGKAFGNLQRLKGVVYYTLSPAELNPFKGLLFPGISNNIRRFFLNNLVPVGIPFTIGYMSYYYVSEEYKRLQRKNPADFKDDV